MQTHLKLAVKAAILAGKEIMKVYARDFDVTIKKDNSPLTEADQAANAVIVNLLQQTPVPIISEENKQLPYEIRKDWNRCWIVDPLDGTKEFIKKNDEFTVNIALVEKGLPVMGVILVPATGELYYAVVDDNKAYKVKLESENESVESLFAKAKIITPFIHPILLRVVGSRSHMNEATSSFMEKMERETDRTPQIVPKGSSLKFCLIAEGFADVYPRYGPTMEWDTAAGHAICRAVGIPVIDMTSGKEMKYNKENLLNNHFIVTNE
jgi:3'(2'), 5'-bisphosphate nucleotidase